MTVPSEPGGARAVRRRLIVGLAVAGALLAAAAPAQAAKRSIYLSLGDSLAWGYAKAPDGSVTRSDRDYSSLLAGKARRSRRYSKRLKLFRIGCPGETTVTYRFGDRCEYAGFPSQNAAARRFLEVNRRHVAFVTLSLGTNAFAACVRRTNIDENCLTDVAKRFEQDLGPILRGLRKAAGPKVKIVVATPYDPYLALYLRGEEHRQAALDTVEVMAAVSDQVYWDAWDDRVLGDVADVFKAFRTSELEQMVTVQGQQAPIAVREACALTLMCHDEPVGPDVHPTHSGHERIARTFAKTLGIRWRARR